MESESSEPPSFYLQSLNSIFVDHWSTPENWLFITIIIVLMILSALVSGSEIAFFSFKADDLEDFKNSKSPVDNTIYELVSRPRRLLSTILIANNFFNIGIVVVSFFLMGNIFDFEGRPAWVQVVVETGLVTFLIVLFGEVIPKVYATQRGKQLARFMAKPLYSLSNFLRPFSSLLINSADGLEKKMSNENDDNSISAEEVDMAIDLTTKGQATPEEVQILKSIVRFGEISVRDVMTSRPDIISMSDELSFEQVIQEIRVSGFSRIPIFQGDLDHVIGILYAKDLLAYLDEDNQFEWQSLIRTPFFVPENKKIDDLLEDFQSNHTHMALVVDEYGGTAGIITLEDVLEEIIGEIKDEFDVHEHDILYEKIDDNRYIFEGKTSIFDLCKIINADYQLFEEVKGDSDSIGGLILELAGKFPKKKQVLEVENYLFKVLDLDQKRIKSVEIEILS